MDGRISRRDFFKLGGGALAGGLVLGLAGCGSGTAGGNTQLRMSWWGSTERNRRTNEVLRLFQERNPEVGISAEYTGDFGEYWNRLATQASGGNAPDVMQTDYRYLREYSERGILLALSEHVPEPISLENFDEDVLEGGKIDGEIYGITLGNNSQMSIYDVGRIEDAGVDVPDYEWTWDDLAEIAAQIAEVHGDGFFGTADAGGSEPPFEVFVRQKGMSLYDENGQLGYDEEALADWWTYWDDLRKAGAAASGQVQTIANTGAVEDTPLIRGHAAINFNWSNQYTAFSALTERELELNIVPNSPGEAGIGAGQYLKPSMLISAYSRTDHPEESSMLIDFILNDRDANQILGTERGISGNREIREMLRGDVPPVERRVFEFIDFVSEHAMPLPAPPPQGAGEIEQLFIRTNENISFGRISVDDAVKQFRNEAQRILEQAG